MASDTQGIGSKRTSTSKCGGGQPKMSRSTQTAARELASKSCLNHIIGDRGLKFTVYNTNGTGPRVYARKDTNPGIELSQDELTMIALAIDRVASALDMGSSFQTEIGPLIYLSVADYKSKPLVSIREFYFDLSSGNERPSKNGVSMTLEEFELFKHQLVKIHKDIDLCKLPPNVSLSESESLKGVASPGDNTIVRVDNGVFLHLEKMQRFNSCKENIREAFLEYISVERRRRDIMLERRNTQHKMVATHMFHLMSACTFAVLREMGCTMIEMTSDHVQKIFKLYFICGLDLRISVYSPEMNLLRVRHEAGEAIDNMLSSGIIDQELDNYISAVKYRLDNFPIGIDNFQAL